MAALKLSNDELWKMVEADRLREQELREPYRLAFLATDEEVARRKIEGESTVDPTQTGIAALADRLARLGSEAVRFERYLIRQGFYPGVAPDDPAGACGQSLGG
jgi:hypothetical protein